jgi:hypothetical protein
LALPAKQGDIELAATASGVGGLVEGGTGLVEGTANYQATDTLRIGIDAMTGRDFGVEAQEVSAGRNSARVLLRYDLEVDDNTSAADGDTPLRLRTSLLALSVGTGVRF